MTSLQFIDFYYSREKEWLNRNFSMDIIAIMSIRKIRKCKQILTYLVQEPSSRGSKTDKGFKQMRLEPFFICTRIRLIKPGINFARIFIEAIGSKELLINPTLKNH
jgi:hypothetical protein